MDRIVAIARSARGDSDDAEVGATDQLTLGVCLALVGCGDDRDPGEPIDGTIEFTVGAGTIRPTAGAALGFDSTPPDRMDIYIATSTIRCGVDGYELPPTWLVSAQVDNAGPATWQTDVALTRYRGEIAEFHSDGPGTVVIDSIGTERVTGSLSYEDPTSTPPVSVNGTFDVIRCF